MMTVFLANFPAEGVCGVRCPLSAGGAPRNEALHHGGASTTHTAVHPAGDGNVWLGILRLSEGPWRPSKQKQLRGLREEDLPPDGGNSSRDTSFSDDGSGASDGASDGHPEVTMDFENTTTSEQQTRHGVNFSHEGSNAVFLGGAGLRRGGGARRKSSRGLDFSPSLFDPFKSSKPTFVAFPFHLLYFFGHCSTWINTPRLWATSVVSGK